MTVVTPFSMPGFDLAGNDGALGQSGQSGQLWGTGGALLMAIRSKVAY
jgi:hypothetical protein